MKFVLSTSEATAVVTLCLLLLNVNVHVATGYDLQTCGHGSQVIGGFNQWLYLPNNVDNYLANVCNIVDVDVSINFDDTNGAATATAAFDLVGPNGRPVVLQPECNKQYVNMYFDDDATESLHGEQCDGTAIGDGTYKPGRISNRNVCRT